MFFSQILLLQSCIIEAQGKPAINTEPQNISYRRDSHIICIFTDVPFFLSVKLKVFNEIQTCIIETTATSASLIMMYYVIALQNSNYSM